MHLSSRSTARFHARALTWSALGSSSFFDVVGRASSSRSAVVAPAQAPGSSVVAELAFVCIGVKDHILFISEIYGFMICSSKSKVIACPQRGVLAFFPAAESHVNTGRSPGIMLCVGPFTACAVSSRASVAEVALLSMPPPKFGDLPRSPRHEIALQGSPLIDYRGINSRHFLRNAQQRSL